MSRLCSPLTYFASQLIDAISLALPTSTVYPLLSTLPPPNPTAPLATPYHSIQLAVSSPLSALLEVVSLTEAESNQLIEAEIKKRRQRLGGQTLSAADTRRAVEGEFLRDSRLPDLYRAVLEEPDASEQEELRRETERKLLNHLRTLLRALPSSFDAATSIAMNKVEKRKEVKDEEERLKGATRSKVEELASGMVLIGIAEERAWEVVLDWQDRYGAWDSVNWRELERYWDLFPEYVNLLALCSMCLPLTWSLYSQEWTRSDRQVVSSTASREPTTSRGCRANRSPVTGRDGYRHRGQSAFDRLY